MTHKRFRQLPRLLPVCFWLLVWELLALALSQPLLLPTPQRALTRLGALILTQAFWGSVFTSSARILSGFLISALLAVLCACLSLKSTRFEALIAPLVSAVKAVPVVSFIILALVWLQSQQLSLFIAALMVFPPLYLNLLEGLRGIDRQLLELGALFPMSPGAKLHALYLPALLPCLKSALALSLGLCWKAGIAAEVIGLPNGTIGEQLYTSKVYFETADLFAWTAVIVLLSAIFEKLAELLLNFVTRPDR